MEYLALGSGLGLLVAALAALLFRSQRDDARHELDSTRNLLARAVTDATQAAADAKDAHDRIIKALASKQAELDKLQEYLKTHANENPDSAGDFLDGVLADAPRSTPSGSGMPGPAAPGGSPPGNGKAGG